MKKIFSIIILSVFFTLIFFYGCKDDNFTELYYDPSKTTTVTVDKLMTGVFQRAYEYTMPWYGRYFTFETQQIGRFAQTLGWVNVANMYLGMGEMYNDNRWKNFYQAVTQFRLLEDTYNKLSDNEKKEYEVFIVLSKIFLYDHLQQMVDLWGDVPFKEAGYLPETFDIISSRASYDAAADLYTMMLDDLKTLNTFFTNYTKTDLVSTMLPKQDFINAGDLTKWRRYCNSLRLRIAARAADNGPLAATAQGIVKEILSDANTYPIVTSNAENILINNQPPDIQANNTNQLRDGFESWTGQCNRASKALVDALTGDPRLVINFDTNADGDYVGIDPLMDASQQQDLFSRPIEQGGNYFSSVDTSTFSRNPLFPGIIITVSEIDFIRAEAIQKWGLSGNAQESFEAGVAHSIDFYYYLNSLGDYRADVPPPSATEIATFATSKWDEESNKEKAIAIQKWIHYGNILMVQAWSEIRKTGYPQLQFQVDNTSKDTPTVPDRLRYTTNEKSYNEDNYAKVQSKDTNYNKLFWAK